MATFVSSKSIPRRSNSSSNFLMIILMALAGIMYFSQTLPPPDAQLNMEKEPGRNEKHASVKAREQAEQEYEKVKEQFQEWNRKPNKTPEDKAFIKKLRKLLERLRQKKDFSGENHSQKPKGF